jgi:hypothetical protein
MLMLVLLFLPQFETAASVQVHKEVLALFL